MKNFEILENLEFFWKIQNFFGKFRIFLENLEFFFGNFGKIGGNLKFSGKFGNVIFLENLEFFFGKFGKIGRNLKFSGKFGKIWGNLKFSVKFVKFGIFLENFEIFWKI